MVATNEKLIVRTSSIEGLELQEEFTPGEQWWFWFPSLRQKILKENLDDYLECRRGRSVILVRSIRSDELELLEPKNDIAMTGGELLN